MDVRQQVPELARDIATPDYCAATGELRAVNAWLGPAGTVLAPLRCTRVQGQALHGVCVEFQVSKHLR